ncbi:putative ribonuclease H-like domain-containing protein [Tanacetum coccineum]|uniref:Ribonuclease H-like domain-containing protein n=1 Tax=Tanacetum coccineum TaxID=301880 RepID=A0ABQ5AG20_9ASTR
MSNPANDDFSQHLSDGEESNHEDASDTGACTLNNPNHDSPILLLISNIKTPNSEGRGKKDMTGFNSYYLKLEAHGAEVSTEDANHKFLRSLPSAWSNLAMTMRTNPEIDNLSIDDFTCTPSTSSTNVPEKEILVVCDELGKCISKRVQEGNKKRRFSLSTIKNCEAREEIRWFLLDNGRWIVNRENTRKLKKQIKALRLSAQAMRCSKRNSIGKPSNSDLQSPKNLNVSTSFKWRYTPKPQGDIDDSFEHPLKNMVDRGIFDSGCSGHKKVNKDQLEIFEEFNVGWMLLTFGAQRSSFHLETECLVVSSDFKMPDENQILLKVPRHHNMYSFDMKTHIPAKGFACLIAKATSDESKLWHRRLGHINFKNLNKLVKGNLVRGLPSKVFKNDHTCVVCHKGKQHRASCKAKLERLITEPLHTLHMDLFGPTSVKSINHASYCLVITDDCTRFSWVFFLASKDETSGILQTFIRQIENQLSHRVKIIRSDNGTEFKNRDMLEFCGNKGIKQEYSNARTPQQNGVAERMNRTLIEAARTMLADSLLPTTFWAEAVSTACYIFNRVRVTKPQNKTPYELLFGHKPIISYIRPFGCHVTILDTLSVLGKFDGKSDEGFLVGYSLNSKAYRVYNLVTKRVEVNLHVNFLEDKPNVKGVGYRWMYPTSIASEEKDEEVELIVVPSAVKIPEEKDESRTSSTNSKQEETLTESQKEKKDSSTDSLEDNPKIQAFRRELEEIALKHLGTVPENNTTSTPSVNTGSQTVNTGRLDHDDSLMPELEIFHKPETGIFDEASYDEEGVITDFNSLPTEIEVSPTPTLRIHSIHPKSQILGDPKSAVQTRSKVQNKSGAHALLSHIQKQQRNNHKDQQHCLFACFLSQEEPKKIAKALQDDSWFKPIKEELLQFKLQQVWVLVDLPHGMKVIGTKWVYRNKRDERGMVVRNKARLVAQGYTQEEGLQVKQKQGRNLHITGQGGSNLDRKSITDGCQFLVQRLISWQVINRQLCRLLQLEAEYVAAAIGWFAEIVDLSLEFQPEIDKSSLNTDLKQTKLTIRENAISEVSQESEEVGRFLKRRNMVLSYSEEEEPEAQGRKREEQVEDISPNTLEAAKTLSKVASLKPRSIDKGRRYKRRKEAKGKKVVSSLDFQEEVDTGTEQVNTAEGVSTGSTKFSTGSEQVSTVGDKKSTSSPDKGQRAGKAPMIIEETPKKSKEQVLQEEASLAEAIRIKGHGSYLSLKKLSLKNSKEYDKLVKQLRYDGLLEEFERIVAAKDKGEDLKWFADQRLLKNSIYNISEA